MSDTLVMFKTTDEHGKVKIVIRVPTLSELVTLRTSGSRALAAGKTKALEAGVSAREIEAPPQDQLESEDL